LSARWLLGELSNAARKAFSSAPMSVDWSRPPARFDLGISLASSCLGWRFTTCGLPPLTLVVI